MRHGRTVTTILLSTMVVIALTLTGCAKRGGETSASQGTDDTTVITWWRHIAPAFNQAYDELAERYMAEHPDVVIEFEDFDYDTYIQTLQTAFPAGTEADVIFMFGTWIDSYKSRLAPVPDSLLSANEAESAIEPSTLGGYLIDGTLYGIPVETNIEYGGILINTVLADEAGIDWEDGWQTWDEFVPTVGGLSQFEDGVMLRAGYGFTHSDGLAYHTLSLIRQLGGSHMSADGTSFTFDTPEARQALMIMKSLVDAGAVDPVLFNDEENWIGDAYFSEIMVSGAIGPWVIEDYKGDFPEIVEHTTYVPMPTVGDEPSFVAASGWGLVVSDRSEVKEEAWDVVKYFALNQENTLSFNIDTGTLPALKANLEGESLDRFLSALPYMEAFVDVLPYGVYQGHMPDSDLVVYDILYNNVLQFLQGNITVDEAVTAIQAQAQETF